MSSDPDTPDRSTAPGPRRVERRRLARPAVKQLLRRHESAVGRLSGVAATRHGRSYAMWEVVLDGRTCFARIDTPEALRMQTAVAAVVADHGVPIAPVVASGHDDELGLSFVVQEEAVGAPLADTDLDGERRHAFLLDAGRVLRRVHGIATTGYGPVATPTAPFAAATGEWFDWHAGRWPDPTDVLDAGLLTSAEVDEARHAWRSALEMPRPESSLLHSDWSPMHLFVSDNAAQPAVSAVIDWGSVACGDWRQDLAKLFWHHPIADAQTIVEGYGRDVDQRLVVGLALTMRLGWICTAHRRKMPELRKRLDMYRHLLDHHAGRH